MMARLPRFYLPGQSLHVIQHGNNREPIFAAETGNRGVICDLFTCSGLSPAFQFAIDLIYYSLRSSVTTMHYSAQRCATKTGKSPANEFLTAVNNTVEL